LLGLALVAAAALVVAAVTFASASYSDVVGDANDAPDIRSVTVSESADAKAVIVRVRVGNFDALPADSGIVLLFDLDLNTATGAGGSEVAARYSSSGAVSLLRWSGFEFLPVSASGMEGTFASGMLTLTIDRALLADATSFGIDAVASRGQTVGDSRVVASDFPSVGQRNVYAPPGEISFADPQGDEDVAPDISAISVSDTSNGIVTFRVTTENYRTLGEDKLIGFAFNLVGRPSSADQVFLTYQGGSDTADVEREIAGFVTQDTPPDRVTTSYADGVLTLAIHRSELDDAAAFRFAMVSADLVGAGEGEGEDAEGDIEAVDFAPEGAPTGEFLTYRLANPPPIRLSVGRPSGVPASPRSGKPFTVNVVVTRSDTGKAVRRGSVSCAAFVGSARVKASGGFRAGKARCSLVVPAEKRSSRVRGTMTIRAAGASVRSPFSFVVR
jgi:hypothetical protein